MTPRKADNVAIPWISSNPNWNLTKPEWITHAEDDERLGMAIIWLIDQSGSYEQLFIPSVSYRRTGMIVAALGTDPMTAREDLVGGNFQLRFDAVRWIPNDVMNVSRLLESSCGGRCDADIECVDPACRCIGGKCRRK
jgi:hypothetical protein